MEQARKGGILKGGKAALHHPMGLNGDASSISSLHSASTQASVYAPTFNPTYKPPSDSWYDTPNGSDASMLSDPNGGLGLNVALAPHPMPSKIVEGSSTLPHQAIDLATPPPNLAPHLAPPHDTTLAPNLAPHDPNLPPSINPPIALSNLSTPSDAMDRPLAPNPHYVLTDSSNFNGIASRHGTLNAKPPIEDSQGYFSDASSTNSYAHNRLKPCLYTHFPSQGSRASRLEPTILEEAPKLPSSTIVVDLPFKERNFNFDFENVSLTSTMGVQAFEAVYGKPPMPTPNGHMPCPSYSSDKFQSYAPQYQGNMSAIGEQSTTSFETPTPTSHYIDHQSHAHQYEGHVPHIGVQSTMSSQASSHASTNPNNVFRPNLRRTSSVSGGETREMGVYQDDHNGISMSSKTRSFQRSSLSSTSTRLVSGPLEASLSKKATSLEVSKQYHLDQSNDLLSEDLSSETSERNGNPLQKALTMGTKGAFLLCIPTGNCLPEPNVKSICPGFTEDYDSMDIKDCMKSLWADTHQPLSFDAFLFHVQQAQLLRQLISQGNCPHILFHGSSNYGKKSLIMALLREIFGPATWKVSQEMKEFTKKGEKRAQIQMEASKFHVELDADMLEENARTILVGLFKEITQSLDSSRIIDSDGGYHTHFRVVVIYGIEKLSNDTQQLIRWLMDRYGDTCKLLLCSDHVDNVLDPIKIRCQIVGVDPPSQQEMVNVLQYIAREEKMRVSLNFITRIVNESNHNLRHAIESLEARKPSLRGQALREDLPIPTGWEDVVVELSKDILMEQTPKRMFVARNKIQALLKIHVPPQLILQSLAIELLRRLNSQLKREICYWHRLYETRLSSTNSTIDKLEEFVAKIMSIYKKHKKAIEVK